MSGVDSLDKEGMLSNLKSTGDAIDIIMSPNLAFSDGKKIDETNLRKVESENETAAFGTIDSQSRQTTFELVSLKPSAED